MLQASTCNRQQHPTVTAPAISSPRPAMLTAFVKPTSTASATACHATWRCTATVTLAIGLGRFDVDVAYQSNQVGNAASRPFTTLGPCSNWDAARRPCRPPAGNCRWCLSGQQWDRSTPRQTLIGPRNNQSRLAASDLVDGAP